MGATDSKLAFRKGVFRLFEERVNYPMPFTIIFVSNLFSFCDRMFPLLQMTIGLW